MSNAHKPATPKSWTTFICGIIELLKLCVIILCAGCAVAAFLCLMQGKYEGATAFSLFVIMALYFGSSVRISP